MDSDGRDSKDLWATLGCITIVVVGVLWVVAAYPILFGYLLAAGDSDPDSSELLDWSSAAAILATYFVLVPAALIIAAGSFIGWDVVPSWIRPRGCLALAALLFVIVFSLGMLLTYSG